MKEDETREWFRKPIGVVQKVYGGSHSLRVIAGGNHNVNGKSKERVTRSEGEVISNDDPACHPKRTLGRHIEVMDCLVNNHPPHKYKEISNVKPQQRALSTICLKNEENSKDSKIKEL